MRRRQIARPRPLEIQRGTIAAAILCVPVGASDEDDKLGLLTH